MKQPQSYSEADLRDQLAANPSVLEPGLKVMDTEYHLPNLFGAGGFIDILARDPLGLHVVIELKRSDATARQAIHELYKYTALLKEVHGLSPAAVRCVLVSTDWRELLIPFSSFVRSVPFHVDGYKLQVTPDGHPISATRIEVLEEATSLELCPKHTVFLYANERLRDAALFRLEEKIKQYGVENSLLVEQDYTGSNEAVIYRACHYFVMATLSEEERRQIEETTGITVDEEEEQYSDGWHYEEALQGKIVGDSLDFIGTMEIGYPEKFAAEENWVVKRIIRHGRFESEVLRGDDELLRLIRAEAEGLTPLFKAVANPRFRPSWEKVRRDVRGPLMGAGSWAPGVERFLDELEIIGDASVGFSIFSPTNLLLALYKFGSDGNPLYFPTLEILVTETQSDSLRVFVGFLEWDGATCPSDPQQVLDELFDGDLVNYGMALNFNELWPAEERLLELHGLSYSLYEIIPHGSASPDRSRIEVLPDGGLKRESMPEAEFPAESLFRFFSENPRYVARLAELFRSQTIGL